MARDMEDRIRRSLQARSGDVQPNHATWETVQTRIRRRTWARWSVAGATAAAALLLAVLVLPGLLTQTRIDLGPADPLPGLTSGLVTTDGETIAVRDAGGELLAEFDPPTEADDPLPITRVAVRPGSSGDELTVAYTRADQGCERVETGWVTAAGDDVTGGTLGGGQGFCITDPVWSPEGDMVGWIEREPDGAFTLQLQGWGDDGPRDDPDDFRVDLETPADLEALRATDWSWEGAGGAVRGALISVSGVGAGGTVRPHLLEGEPAYQFLLPSAEPSADSFMVSGTVRPLDGGGARSRLLAGLGLASRDQLAVDEAGTVALSRSAPGTDDPQSRGPLRRFLLPLDAEVVTAEELVSGDAWLSSVYGSTVAFGADGDAWTVRWEGDDWGELQALPGVVHADVLALGEAEPEPTPAPVALPYVSTDGAAIALHGPDGSLPLAEAQEGDIIDFAVHPASTTDDVTVVWREGRGCDATLHHRRVAGDAETPARELPATCPGRPAFAPDGTHLAWMSQPDLSSGETAAGQVGLETLAWTDGAADSLVTFGVQAEQPETVAFDVADWVWTEGHGTPTAGRLHLVGYDTHGTPSAHTLPIERQGDGALALLAGATAQERPAIIEVDSHLNDGAAVGPSYVLDSVPGTDPNTLRVTRSVDGDQSAEFRLPDGLLTVYGAAVETDNVWMTARGHDVLLGDGNGAAWRLPWTAEGRGELTELDGEVRYAVPLTSAVADEPRPEAEPAPHDPAPEEPAPQDDPAGLPAAVAATRDAIREAAAAGDVDGLVQLAGEEFTSSFGGTENPRAFFQRLLAEGELDRLARILELPHGEQDGIYSWPFAHTRDLESLSSAELQSLETIATQDEIDSWFDFGGYAGWRAGVAADGTWLYYVAGD